MLNGDFNGWETVSLNLYVQDVSNILPVYSEWRYSGPYTPRIIKMSHSTWPTSTAYVVGKTANSYLKNMQIKLGQNFAVLGDEDELNPETYNLHNMRSSVFYRPPDDLAGNFLNLTYLVSDQQEYGNQGTGYANMFPNYFPQNYLYDSSFGDNFDTTIRGKVYSMLLLPVVSEISPAHGSLAGGTEITIAGHGFTDDVTKLFVYSGGLPCDVSSSSADRITCITRPRLSADEILAMIDTSEDSISFKTSAVGARMDSMRNAGSPGWWFKFWNYNDFVNGRVGSDTHVKMSFGFKQDMYFSMFRQIGSNWAVENQDYLDYSSGTGDSRYFRGELSTVLIAPYTGNYTFYAFVDDFLRLYGAVEDPTTGVAGAETLLMTTLCCNEGNYFARSDSISKTIQLKRGDRYVLRGNYDNSGGVVDYLKIALRIEPQYESDGRVGDFNSSVDLKYPEITKLPAYHSKEFLRKHSVKDIQTIGLSYDLKYEKQVLIDCYSSVIHDFI